MIDIAKFIYEELQNSIALEYYVQDRIFHAKAPVKTKYPLIVVTNISANIDLKGFRNELWQVSVYSKNPDTNEEIKDVIINNFFRLKKAPIKSVTIWNIVNRTNNQTWSYAKHVELRIKALETITLA